MRVHESDVLVIGSGIAGLSFVLNADDDVDIALVTKKQRADSNTNYAQGGIAAVMDPSDDFDLHIADTLRSGAGLCHTATVRDVVREGPERVHEMIEWGVRFSRENGRLSLGREGGHSRRRIVHAADLTGREIEQSLLQAASDDPSVTMFEDHLAADLILADGPPGGRRCIGARVLDRETGEIIEFRARFTLLASGGLGHVYRHTTNPEIATGDGVAMAYRACAEIANMEFVQFHPTALYPAEDQAVLISEAVRGEGAVLRKQSGELLLQDHPLGSLATRDVVARAIDRALEDTGDPFVVLDLSAIAPDTIERRFPNIFGACLERGIDIREEPIPVVPAAHYACGGVRTDSYGRTSVPGLLAAGEVASTGVHGANRLASNSLLEAVVYSHRAASHVNAELRSAPPAPPPAPAPEPRLEPDGPGPSHWAERAAEVRDLMWRDAGIVRRTERLERAGRRLREIAEEIEATWECGRPEVQRIELRNLVQCGELIVRCALMRRESRGLHCNEEIPHRDNERYLRDTVVSADAVTMAVPAGGGV